MEKQKSIDLGNDLVLRRASLDDMERVANFNARIHSDDGPDQPEESIAVWTRELFNGTHPTCTPNTVTVVEDTSTGELVSTALLIPQTWAFEGIPFGVGRPELIGTHPDYRQRGLMRKQMAVLHEWSAELGHEMQVITGIPWFYRQFGYEMALDLGGGREAYHATIPALPEGQAEKYHFRSATAEDLDFIRTCYDHTTSGDHFSCIRTPAEWAYEVLGKSSDNHNRMVVQIIQETDGKPVGYAAYPIWLSGKLMEIFYAGLLPESSWLDVAPALMRTMQQTGLDYAKRDDTPCDGIYFSLGANHPIFTLFPRAFPKKRNPYAWYVRIPDLAGFIRKIAPALEKRLAASVMHGYNGEITLGFYRSGIRLVFENGRLTASEDWRPTANNGGVVRFPDLTFLSLLCGRHSFETLSQFFPDCYSTRDDAAALLSILFPPHFANVWAVE